jgi:hypothetical protein
MDNYFNIISLVMGLSSFIGGMVLWYRGSVEKRYAAERDFAHLRRNYEQLCQELMELEEKIDTKSGTLLTQFLEIKALLYAVLGERTSGGSMKFPHGD